MPDVENGAAKAIASALAIIVALGKTSRAQAKHTLRPPLPMQLLRNLFLLHLLVAHLHQAANFLQTHDGNLRPKTDVK